MGVGGREGEREEGREGGKEGDIKGERDRERKRAREKIVFRHVLLQSFSLDMCYFNHFL